MKVGIFLSTCSLNGVNILKKFYKGIKKTGDIPLFLDNLEKDVDIAVVWSVLWTKPEREKIYNFYSNLSIPIIVVEVGGILRNKSWRIGINNINNEGLFPFKKESRWYKFNKKIKDYNLSGNKIIICGQNEYSKNWPKNLTTENWVNNIVFEIKKYTDKKIYFSCHPRFKPKFENIKNFEIITPKFVKNSDDTNLDELLEDCCLLINYNSNSGLQGVFNGVNVFVDKSSLCFDVSIEKLENINNLKAIERKDWLEKISYTEWFEDEIEEGIPYILIKETIKNKLNK